MADRGEAGPMRGRGAEFETVLGLLDGTQQGQGRMLLVEGEPGTGKSLLLARAGEEAGRRGFRVVAAAADELSPAPLPDGLEELASAGPVLVTVDNVQWADLATTQALRSMPRLLASYPLSWILAMGTSPDAGPGELLFGLLESDGAARISFGPLDYEAQAALIGDVLGAVSDQTLIELAADAAGNPLVLAEAFRGLRDENAIVVRDGHASLARPDEQRPGDEPDRDPGPGPAQGTLRSRQAVRGDGVGSRGFIPARGRGRDAERIAGRPAGRAGRGAVRVPPRGQGGRPGLPA